MKINENIKIIKTKNKLYRIKRNKIICGMLPRKCLFTLYFKSYMPKKRSYKLI